MKIHSIEKRIRKLESASMARLRVDLRTVAHDDLLKAKKIYGEAMETNDWRGVSERLALEAPTVFDAFRKSGSLP